MNKFALFTHQLVALGSFTLRAPYYRRQVLELLQSGKIASWKDLSSEADPIPDDLSMAHSLHRGVSADRALFRKYRKEYLSTYDAGGYCHSTAADGDLRSSRWGETSMPKGYAERNWQGFELVEFLRDEDTMLSQNLIVARRK
jgi:hypothetical protein